MPKSSLEPFDGGDFAEYLERLQFFLLANEIGVVPSNATNAEKTAAAKRRAAYLVSMLSKDVYSTFKSLCLPDKPADKNFKEMSDILLSYYKVKKNRTTAAYQFRQCIQSAGEGVVDFGHRLKRAAVECEYGDHLDRALQDQFMAGLRDPEIKRKLLTSPDTTKTFVDMLTVAEQLETAGQFAKELQPHAATASTPGPDGASVHKVRHHRQQQRPAKSQPAAQSKKSVKSCYRCGSDMHLANKCPHLNTECNYCHRRGHLERACLKKKRSKSVHHIDDDQDSGLESQQASASGESVSMSDASVPMYQINAVNGGTRPPYMVSAEINGSPLLVKMEIDTGSSVSILNKRDFEKLGTTLSSLSPPTVQMVGFSGSKIPCLGEKEMPVNIKGSTHSVLLRVVDNGSPSIMGRDMLSAFQLNWKEIFAVKVEIEQAYERNKLREEILEQYRELFTGQIGKLNTTQVKLRVKDEPVYMKARTIPFAIKEKYETALENLEKQGIIRKVNFSHWASPTVPVKKPDGNVRICADYSRTINAKSELESHPLPTLDEMLTKLANGVKFTKLDLAQAYHQLELDPDSRQFTTISTHKGLYEYTRLPFGIHSAVSIFQRTMEAILADIPGCVLYIDDILVTGENDEEHLANLKRVLNRLHEVGMKLKPAKFEFMLHEINYLGHTFSENGITPSGSKVQALQLAKPPSTVSELQSFIGTANYLRRYVPHFASVMAPLYSLLKKEAKWQWGEPEQSAFKKIKEILCSETVLAHYSPSKETILQTDASGVGLGAVLLQKENGEFHPVAYASRVLTDTEKRYSNIERESLALVFGVTKFRQYLLGREFTLRTDHKPLLNLFGHENAVPILVSPRLKKWKLVLSAYHYTMEYVPGKDNVFADFMSRKPVQDAPSVDELVESQVLFIESEVVSATTLATETSNDPVLKRVLQYTLNGWPQSVDDPKLQPFYAKRWELSVSDSILVWNERVVVPESLRSILLNDLHFEHSGIVRMKRMARRYLWWPGLDKDIESMAHKCKQCQENARMPAKEYGSWSWPTGPWQRLHLDFAGPFLGKMFLVFVDSYSRFVDVIPMDKATSASTISALRRDFAMFGLPVHLVTDNGSQFTSAEFKQFLQLNGIQHTCTAPGHPATNGLAERYVGHFKQKMKAMGSNGDWQATLQRFLLTQRTTPMANGKSPAEMLFNRQPRTRFDSLKQRHNDNVQKFETNLANNPEFQPGQAVFAINYGVHGAKWIPGVVVSVISPLNYQVQVGDVLWKRHRNQLRMRSMQLSELQASSAEYQQPESTVPTTAAQLDAWVAQHRPMAETDVNQSAPSTPQSLQQPRVSTSPDDESAPDVQPSEGSATPQSAHRAAEHQPSDARHQPPLPASGAVSRPRRQIQKPVRYR